MALHPNGPRRSFPSRKSCSCFMSYVAGHLMIFLCTIILFDFIIYLFISVITIYIHLQYRWGKSTVEIERQANVVEPHVLLNSVSHTRRRAAGCPAAGPGPVIPRPPGHHGPSLGSGPGHRGLNNSCPLHRIGIWWKEPIFLLVCFLCPFRFSCVFFFGRACLLCPFSFALPFWGLVFED